MQANFLDIYKHLPKKAITGIEWVAKYCSSIKYIIKTDDDTIVNIFKFVPQLERIFQNSKTIFYCNVLLKQPTNSAGGNKCPKWCIKNKNENQAFKWFYPPYCSGFIFIFTKELLLDLNNAISDTKLDSPVDDFIITGLLPLKMNVSYVQGDFHLYRRKYQQNMTWLAAVPGRGLWFTTVIPQWKGMLKRWKKDILKYIELHIFNNIYRYSHK